MSRVVGIVAAATLLAPSGCREACPDGWDYDDAARICAPPEAVTAAAERALGTGIYGYAAACSPPSDEDDALEGCKCAYDELAEGGTTVMVVGELDESGVMVPTSRLTIPVRSDSTYEAELVAGVAYQVDFINKPVKTADGIPMKTIVLAEGQVQFLQLFANDGCPDIF